MAFLIFVYALILLVASGQPLIRGVSILERLLTPVIPVKTIRALVVIPTLLIWTYLHIWFVIIAIGVFYTNILRGQLGDSGHSLVFGVWLILSLVLMLRERVTRRTKVSPVFSA